MADTKQLLGRSSALSLLLTLSLCLPILADQPPATQQPVLVELFTSEGCSSCPPADRLAIRLQGAAPNGHEVIVLSEHVDYWNYLGWQDQYSSPQSTARQQQYARVLGQNSVYTPEAIIDGAYGMVGNNAGSVNDAINRCASAPKASLRLASQNSGTDDLSKKVSISIASPSNLNGKQAELFVAVTEDNLSSNVRSGENAGNVLSHTGVVRSLKKVSALTLAQARDQSYSTEIRLAPRWKRQDLRIVSFLQDPSTQRILGVNQTRIH